DGMVVVVDLRLYPRLLHENALFGIGRRARDFPAEGLEAFGKEACRIAVAETEKLLVARGGDDLFCLCRHDAPVHSSEIEILIVTGRREAGNAVLQQGL